MFNLFQNILDKTKSTFANQNPTQNLQYKAINKLAGGVSAVTGQGMEDKTQSLVFKGIQGSANLYTGVTNGLQQTAQADIADKQKKIDDNARKYASHLASQGYSQEKIFKTLDLLKKEGKLTAKPNVAESIVGGFGNRMEKIAQTTDRLSNIQNPLERTVKGVLPYMGQTVATPLQPIASGIEPFVSPVVQKVIEKTGQTENVQALSEGWSQFEKTNPILAENIAGLLNTAQLAPVPFAKPIANATGNVAKATGKAIVRGAEAVAPKVVKGVKTGVSATGEGVGKVTKSIVSQQSGLGTPAIESFLKNPELQGKIRSGELSAARTLEEARSGIDQVRASFRETGKMYDTVRKANVKVPTSEAKQVLVSQLESEGLASGGKLNLVDLPVKDRGAITQALKYIDEYKGEMNPQSALSIRQKLDDLINYKSEVGSNGQRIVQGLRAKYDEFLGQKLPGLKEIDAQYAPERQFWESVRKDIYKADGTLKDNALSTISNITNKGNEARLARMEQILPGIGEKVKALKAFDDIQAASGIKVGTYTRAATTGGLALVNPAIAVASWIATHPVVVARVLEGIGLATQKIKSIISKGKKITPEEANIVVKAVKETPKSKVEVIINNLSYDPKTNKLTSGSIGPKKLSTMGKIENAKTPKSIVAQESPSPKPIVKNLQKTEKSATIGDMETKKLIEEARKYKSAEEFIKAQGEPVYHGTYAYKTSDIKKIKSIIESIYKKNGGEYTQTDINKIANDAKYILENRSKLKVKDEFLLKNLEDELSSKIKKPTIDFAGKSGKDVTDNSLGIYTTPDIDFAKRFTYDIDINPYSGKKTIVQPRQGYVIDMYYKGNTLDLTKGTSKHIDLLSEITGKDKGFISDKLKTKEGTKTIQKLLSSKREILKEKGFNAVKNYAWDDTVKKYKEELAILDDNSIKTKDELTDIYNQSKPIVKNPLVEEAMRKKLLKK